MNTDLDFSKFDEVVKRAKENPKKELLNASLNDLRLMAFGAANDAYGELIKKLEGNEELKDLLFAYSHLTYVHYDFENVVISDIDVAKKEIKNIWPRLASV